MIRLVYNTPEIHKEYTAINSIDIILEDEASLDEMLKAYESFLGAIGYHIPDNSSLQIVEDMV